MNDIVNRLREWPSPDDAIEAADEIERLRKENKLLRSGWCKESEKRMKEWQNEPIATLNTITTGDTQCRYCNGVGQIQLKYANGDFLCWTMCNRCNGAGTS